MTSDISIVKPAPAVALDSLGCKLNQAEIQQLATELVRDGYRVVPPGKGADIYVLNTCTVTHVADRKSRHLLLQARRRFPNARLIAIGCYAERDPDRLEKINGVMLVLGNRQKWRLPELLGRMGPAVQDHIAPFNGRRTRAFVRVQYGCQNFCTFCVVPLVRADVASIPADNVLQRVRELEAAGYHEVVLTGTEIGTYKDAGKDLKSLLERLLSEVNMPRIRLSSLQPGEITPEFLRLWQDPRLCRHFHLSLQSGSESVLHRMGRRYRVEDYRRTVAMIKDALPDAAITTDVIVGFPGETEAEFRETMNLCRQAGLARLHVFPYSPRPGTAAAVMPQQVPPGTKRQRCDIMLRLAGEIQQDFRRGFIGRTMDVLFELASDGIWSGLTDNYLRVFVKSGQDLAGQILTVRLLGPYRDGVWGEIAER